MSSSSPHHRVQHQHFHNNNNSPTTTLSEDDSNSQPNDLTTSSSSRKHHHNTFPGYPAFFSPPQHPASLQQHSQQPGQQYVATNECRLIEYRGARIAAFLSTNRSCPEYLLCLPQAFELFLKHLVGGLHTVYTKLKRLDIVPIVCNVEQVRILRGLGAIQPGVNRCKLLSTQDFDVLFKDCTTARPGRPPKRSSVPGMVSPIPSSFNSGHQQAVVPYLGYPTKKPRFSEEAEIPNENSDVKQHQTASNNTSGGGAAAATAAAMLANGYSAAFPFLQHFNTGSTPNSQQQQQLVAAAAALGLPGLPPRFANGSPPPGIAPLHPSNGNNSGSDGPAGTPSEFNPTAAYLWLLSQQQQHQQQQQQQQQNSSTSALNLSSRSTNANNSSGSNGTSNINNVNNNASNNLNDEESTDDDDDEDDVESNNSSNNSDNPVTSSGFNGLSCGVRGASETASNRNSSSTPPQQPPQQSQPEHCLETLLRNIEGLLAIAAHNARQQQTQLHLQKAELRAELAAQLEREREMREHLEKQLNEEQKVRLVYQKRFKKERRFRKKLEHEMQHIQQQTQISRQNNNKSPPNNQPNQTSLKSPPTTPPQQPQPQQPQQQTQSQSETVD